jgi:hypothetical protein
VIPKTRARSLPALVRPLLPRRLATAASLAALALLSTACPPDDAKPARADAGARGATCARFGQTCELSPGKLGTCVAKTGCDDGTPACLMCQSQH